jgi:hypothetical protein
VTLILTVATRGFVLQVSDRLVTKHQWRHTHDPASNKKIIFITQDSLVTIGYSGLAYFGSTPTDEWLAGQLSGYGTVVPTAGCHNWAS